MTIKIILGVVLSILVSIGLWYVCCPSIEKSTMLSIEYLVKLLTPALASFGGAYFAFHLRRNDDGLELVEKRVEKINKSLLAILTRLALYKSLNDKILGYNNELSAALSFRRMIVPTSPKYGENISFLLKVNPYMFGKINECQILDSDIVSFIEIRNKLHDEIVRIHYEKIQGKTLDLKSIKKEIGELNACDLLEYTKEIKNGSKKITCELIDLGNDIFNAAKEFYPNEKFLKMPSSEK
ncbi:hypothetical protein [Pseudoalteromonas prydzensis]|uniref:hypothetical protein n=1 Tax=Pseudoalteromonas prydzensis TaxID=182141 RepID=UPI0007E51BFE|nr:hypothetical protein [Pseudoalteromonas prydzensis]MBE0380701.1 hypothetical protein [Pseudoalteromonas prydzensis ACAM 620]